MTDPDTRKLIDRLYQRGMAEDDSCNPDAGDLMRQAAACLTELEAAIAAWDTRAVLDRPAAMIWSPIYSIFCYVPCGGQYPVFVGSLEECRTWVNDLNRGYNLNDCSIYNNDTPDIFSLLNG